MFKSNPQPQGCTAEAGQCLDPFCPTHEDDPMPRCCDAKLALDGSRKIIHRADCTRVGQVIVLDVVAEPDASGASAPTLPSDRVRDEVSKGIARAEAAELREWTRGERAHQRRVSQTLACEKAHTKALNHYEALMSELAAANAQWDELQWQVSNQAAWVDELARMAAEAQRVADKALNRWFKVRGQ